MRRVFEVERLEKFGRLQPTRTFPFRLGLALRGAIESRGHFQGQDRAFAGVDRFVLKTRTQFRQMTLDLVVRFVNDCAATVGRADATARIAATVRFMIIVSSFSRVRRSLFDTLYAIAVQRRRKEGWSDGE